MKDKLKLRFIRAEEGIVCGYIAKWGTRETPDAYGTWFDRENPPEMGLNFVPFPLMFEHGMDDKIRKDYIGEIYDVFFDDIGIGFFARLYKDKVWYKELAEKIANGTYATSSGSSEHLAEFDGEGRFVHWSLAEVSLTEFPAEDTMPSVTFIRSDGRNYFAIGARKAQANDDDEDTTTNQTRRFNMKSKFFNKNGSAITKASALRAIIAKRSVYDEEGNELDSNAVLQMLVNDGETTESLMQMLQEMAQPEDDTETSSDEDAPRSEPEGDADGIPDGVSEADWEAFQAFQALQATATVERSRGGKSRRSSRTQINPHMAQAIQNMAMANGEGADAQGATPLRNGQKDEGVVKPLPVQVLDKYYRMSSAELATAYILAKSVRNRGSKPSPRDTLDTVSEGMGRALVYTVARDMERGDPIADTPIVRHLFSQASPTRSNRAIRSDEVMQSDLAGFGDEWVYDLQGTAVWETIRAETDLYQQMLSMGMDERELPVGFEGETVPLEGADPTWYVTGQASDYDTGSGEIVPKLTPTQFGTANTSIDVAKLSAVLWWTNELSEDSAIAIAPEAQRKLQTTAVEQIENIMVNGDTDLSATTNINDIAGTPTASPAQPAFTLLNGLIKKALVTYAGTSAYDASGTISDEIFLQLMLLMDKKHRRNRDRLMFLTDSDSLIAFSNLATLKTRDVFSGATLEEGVINKIWRINLAETAEMELANTAGKIDLDTPANNTRGRLLLIRPDRWASRWKRRLTTAVTYDDLRDTYRVTAHMRWGLQVRDSNGVKIAYNIDRTL